MPAKEIKELRQSGKLEEALEMALAELDSQPDNIWAKRNIAWVYYDFAKQNTLPEKFDVFSSYISKIIELALPEDEKMIFDNSAWLIIKMGYALLKMNNVGIEKYDAILSHLKQFNLTKPSESYSALFKMFHKIFKENPLKYVELADWWNFENFRKEDYEKERLPDGKSVMSIVEQAYIAYARHLLPRQLPNGETYFYKEKATAFLLMLDKIEETHPEYEYPSYFKAKLLLATGEKDNILSSLLPFAKKKRNVFWVWDVLSEAFISDPEKVLACYSKALLCAAKEEMLVNVRQKIASIYVKKEMWDEAKTEILSIQKVRSENNWPIPVQITNWTSQPWFSSAKEKRDNKDIYRKYAIVADEILFYDIPEKTVIVTFVNSERKILNFIASEKEFGFFKYDRFLRNVKIGETLKIRVLKKESSGSYHVATVKKHEDLEFKRMFVKEFHGVARINEGNNFGFVDDVFLAAGFCDRNKLINGGKISGKAVKTFDTRKNKWGWKAFELK